MTINQLGSSSQLDNRLYCLGSTGSNNHETKSEYWRDGRER